MRSKCPVRIAPGAGGPGQTTYCYESGVATVNPGFEFPNVAVGGPGITGHGSWATVQENFVPGWQTDDPSNLIEIWRSPGPDGQPSYLGRQCAEINYVAPTRLWQALAAPAREARVAWRWAHRARVGTGPNRAQMFLGDASVPFTTHQIVSDDLAPANRSWLSFSGMWVKPAGVTNIEVSLRSLTPATGFGNLVDDIQLTVLYTAVPLISCDGTILWIDPVTGETIPPNLIREC